MRTTFSSNLILLDLITLEATFTAVKLQFVCSLLGCDVT